MSSTEDRTLDAESAAWLRSLRSEGAQREAAVAKLHGLLVRAALAETHRRQDRFGFGGPELDDLAHQAAGDAAVAVLGKLDGFRGESRFTTWAYSFVVLEVSSRLGRHLWRRGDVPLDSVDWSVLPERLELDPATQAEGVDVARAVRAAVENLTTHQQRIFRALVLAATPVDVLALELGKNRNAIYKTMFDARRRIRASLVSQGFEFALAAQKGAGA